MKGAANVPRHPRATPLRQFHCSRLVLATNSTTVCQRWPTSIWPTSNLPVGHEQHNILPDPASALAHFAPKQAALATNSTTACNERPPSGHAVKHRLECLVRQSSPISLRKSRHHPGAPLQVGFQNRKIRFLPGSLRNYRIGQEDEEAG